MSKFLAPLALGLFLSTNALAVPFQATANPSANAAVTSSAKGVFNVNASAQSNASVKGNSSAEEKVSANASGHAWGAVGSPGNSAFGRAIASARAGFTVPVGPPSPN